MYRSIVVPLDGSKLAEQVLPYVEELLQGRSAVVYLISVAPLSAAASAPAAPIRMYPLVVSPSDLDGLANERARIEHELRNYLRAVGPNLSRGGVSAQVETRFGEPAEEIIAYASHVNADLIAMCTHGRTGFARWAYGSVAEKVMRHAHCPIRLVRAQQQ